MRETKLLDSLRHIERMGDKILLWTTDRVDADRSDILGAAEAMKSRNTGVA